MAEADKRTKEELIAEISRLKERLAERESAESESSRDKELCFSLNEQLQIILDASPAMIFFKDKENRFVKVNDALARANGMSKQEMEGKTMRDIYPAELAEKYYRDDKDVMLSGKAKINIVEQMHAKTGRLWVRTDKVPFKDLKGNIIGVIGFALDITDRKEAEDELKKKNELLAKFNKIAVDRELRMIELKDEIKKLRANG